MRISQEQYAAIAVSFLANPSLGAPVLLYRVGSLIEPYAPQSNGIGSLAERALGSGWDKFKSGAETAGKVAK